MTRCGPPSPPLPPPGACRAIFRWVIAMDLSKNQVGDIVRPQQTQPLTRGVKSGKETYHQLFKKLCR